MVVVRDWVVLCMLIGVLYAVYFETFDGNFGKFGSSLVLKV